MNREEYTKTKIQKTEESLKQRPSDLNSLRVNMNQQNFESNEEFVDELFNQCSKYDIRPEIFLDQEQNYLQMPAEANELLQDKVIDFQDAEQKAFVAQNDQDVLDQDKTLMKFNPAKINDFKATDEATNDEQNDLVIGNSDEEQFVDYSGVNDVNPLKKAEPENQSDSEIQQQIKKYDEWEKEYREKLKESLSFEKQGVLKERVFDPDSNTFATYTKAIGGGYKNASAGADASVKQIKSMFANVKPPVLNNAPKDEETLKNVVEAWKELKADGYDISKISCGFGVPKAYKEALKELQKQDLVVNQELELDNSLQIGKPIDVPVEAIENESKQTEKNVVEEPKSEPTSDTESPEFQPEQTSQGDVEQENEVVSQEMSDFANELNEKAAIPVQDSSNAYEEPPEFDDGFDFTSEPVNEDSDVQQEQTFENQETDFDELPVQENAPSPTYSDEGELAYYERLNVEKQQIDDDQSDVKNDEVEPEQTVEQAQEEVLEVAQVVDHDAELLKELENDVDNALEQQQQKNDSQKQDRRSRNRQRR
ncbi:hypothetical protein PVK64_14950 [Aliivibrio sp. S4TY2]|uniref:Uncharacterized protein n=1 Tax=Aliivibrio finisterrensis TaxID=511998 RepID=A0A4V1Z8S5_9GAMM|nr:MULTISPECIES: hypothetical protein [Aliivibrio]MDD9157470.1 hypothetical protein [Aliivibrio sp. S4TY2]MDD9161336.1 hypothetical protein [Aliivibrio sp. S4TY1]MDD9165366.1 hypothetical protein [Aliivibrio sp. S4MY2]MDD9169379.1 hypothetical protein [Aliivibrio sp. S4MY4]MDD9179259.1 hypothetical protein [Aliivibrio sp. A6]